MTEDNTRTFLNNWTGTATVINSGDNEALEFNAGEYMESEVVETGAYSVSLFQNEYQTGDTVAIKYRHGSSKANCEAAAWAAYIAPFISDGYVQIRLESTL